MYNSFSRSVNPRNVNDLFEKIETFLKLNDLLRLLDPNSLEVFFNASIWVDDKFILPGLDFFAVLSPPLFLFKKFGFLKLFFFFIFYFSQWCAVVCMCVYVRVRASNNR